MPADTRVARTIQPRADHSARQLLTAVAIHRGEHELLYNPSADTTFQSGDRLVAIGKPAQLVALGPLCGVPVAR